MCQGDVSPVTMTWGRTQPVPLANMASPHACVDWTRLEDWARRRWVDVAAPGLVVHPVLGE